MTKDWKLLLVLLIAVPVSFVCHALNVNQNPGWAEVLWALLAISVAALLIGAES